MPNINDLNYRRIYPDGFSSGSIEIQSLSSNGVEFANKLVEVNYKPLPPKTLYSMQLEKEMAPGETRKFVFKTILNVPEKFGSFGYYRDRLTMSGGWTPYLASYRDGSFYPTDQSPRADWNVTVVSSDKVVVGGRISEAGSMVFQRKNIGQFPIQIGKHLKIEETELNGFKMRTVVDERKPEKVIEPFDNVFLPWSDYVNQLGAFEGGVSKDVTFVQAPLREMLSVDAQDMSFFSDRAYKLVSILHQFHNVPLVRMMFSQWVYPQILKKENDQDYYWINEVIANQLTEDFIQTQHYKTRDARKLGVMRFFSMLPLIDQLIHTPQFAFFDVFYNFSYPYDPVRDEFVRFQHRRQFGRSVISHMQDELGDKIVQDIVHAYIQSPDKTFLQVAEELSGKKLDDRFDHWTAQRPVLNYRLRKVKTKKVENGYHGTVQIEKESSRTIQEPVEIHIREKNGKSQTLIWDSKEAEHTFDFETKSKVQSVEIDPRQRLLETKLSDNRRPPYWKFVLTELFLEYDFNANQPLVYVQSQIRKKYGGQDRYNIGGYYQADSYGTNLGYVRLFGRSLDTLRTSHGLGLQYGFSRLRTDDVLVDATPDQIVRVTDSGFLSTVTASYFFGNQLSFTNPLQGEYGGVAVTYGTSYLGGQFNFYQASASAAKVIMLHPSHLLAFRGVFGVSGPDDMPSQIQFRLGGLTSMRGLGLGEEKYIGRNLLLFSGEYRHFLVQDIDWNLGLFRIRDIQGALFTDAGRVTDTVQETANQVVLGAAAEETSLVDVFKIQDFETDAGYGLRFFVDYLGVSPALLRFDLARSISDQNQGFRFYFGVTQSF
ncbi:MAG: BamA/TamA family outer membrane protein [Bdellovibrionota bacterium]